MLNRAFKWHFNRINMQRGNPNVWTVHYRGKCHQVKEVKCYTPVETAFKKDGRQPRAVLVGFGQVFLDKNKAYIVDTYVVDHMSDDDYFEATSGKEL